MLDKSVSLWYNTGMRYRVKDIFDYDSRGFLVWKVSPSDKVKIGDKAGCIDPRGYTRIGFKGKLYWAHRLIYAWHTGEWPKIVDHINQDKTDNRFENLRATDKSGNTINSDKSWGKIPYRGVYFNKRKNRFVATFKGKHLGYFDKASEASLAYEATRNLKENYS